MRVRGTAFLIAFGLWVSPSIGHAGTCTDHNSLGRNFFTPSRACISASSCQGKAYWSACDTGTGEVCTPFGLAGSDDEKCCGCQKPPACTQPAGCVTDAKCQGKGYLTPCGGGTSCRTIGDDLKQPCCDCVTPARQPAGKHSFLITKDGKGIRDDDFAALMKSKLVMGGNVNVKHAKFLFQECFSGGMLDDLEQQLGMAGMMVPWVGGSAAAWDQTAGAVESSCLTGPKVGQPCFSDADCGGTNKCLRVCVSGDNAFKTTCTSNAGCPNGVCQIFAGGPWTKSLLEQLGMAPNEELTKKIDKAIGSEAFGPNGTKKEYGQSFVANGGETITLPDGGAQSHHAILWVGYPDFAAIYNDTEKVRNQLVNAWGMATCVGGGNAGQNCIVPGDCTGGTCPITITVLYGNGMDKILGKPALGALPADWKAKEATPQELTNAVNALPLDPNEQFLFYAHDHGGSSTTPQAALPPLPPPLPAPVAPATVEREVFPLNRGELVGMFLTPDNVPTLSIDYSGVQTAGADCVSIVDPVTHNPFVLGCLDPAQTHVEFVVPEALLWLTNEIEIANNDTVSFQLLDKELFTGAIPLFEPPDECHQGDFPGFAFLVRTFGKIGNGGQITGSIGANDQGGIFRLGKDVFVSDGSFVGGDAVQLGRGTSIFNLVANHVAAVDATVRGSTGLPLLPFDDNFCPIPTFSCGGADVIVQPFTTTGPLAPGSYGRVVVLSGATLTLAPGTFQFCSFRTGKNATILVTGEAASEIDVSESFRLANGSTMGPDSGTPIPTLNVAGKSVRVSAANARLEAFVHAPQAVIAFGRSAELVGSFCANTSRSDRSVTLRCPLLSSPSGAFLEADADDL